MAPTETFIPISKPKLLVRLLLCLLFIAGGGWFMFSPGLFADNRWGLPTELIWLLGLVTVLFFGYLSFLMLRLLGSRTAGLQLTATGFEDRSSGVAAGFVAWADVLEVVETKEFNQRFLTVFVCNPDDYQARATGWLARKTMSANRTTYGSPINLAVAALSGSSAELKAVLEDGLQRYRTAQVELPKP